MKMYEVETRRWVDGYRAKDVIYCALSIETLYSVLAASGYKGSKQALTIGFWLAETENRRVELDAMFFEVKEVN